MTMLKVGAATDTGRVRSINQDSKLVSDRMKIYAVADGMGGHQGGEVASALAIEALESSVTDPTKEGLITRVELANAVVFEKAAGDPDLRGMGTTLCAIALVDGPSGSDEIAWVNVGDSRIYLLHDGRLEQLSTDHSLVEDLRRDGQLTDEEAAVHPQRNIVTRALGLDPEVEVDDGTVVPYVGDRFLLSSDGLFNEVDSDQILATLRRLDDPKAAADDLVRQANDHGGRDNITCVVVAVVDDGGRSATASAALASGEGPGLDSRTEVLPAVDSNGDSGDHAGFDRASAGGLPPASEDLPFGRSTDDLYSDLDRVKRRHFTGRVLAFILAIALVLGVAFGAIAWYAKRTYFVDFAGSGVAIYQGQPGGLLVFDPEVKVRTEVLRSDLNDAERQAVDGQKTFASLASARTYVNNLSAKVSERQDRTATTTTSAPSTTTAPTTTRPGGTTSSTPTTAP